MKTFLTIIGIIFGVAVLALGGFALYAVNWWKNLTIKPDLASIKSKLPSIIASLISSQKLPVTVLIDNDNNTGLTLNNFQIKGSYQGADVFQSNVIPVIAIPANAKNYAVNGELQLFANASTIKLATELIKNSAPTIQLTVSISKFGMSRDFMFDYQIK